MTIESLFERGLLEDWREFAVALRDDPNLATVTMRVCEARVDPGSAALARTLVRLLYPGLRSEN